MPDKTPENDLKEIWRSQPTEPMEGNLGSHRLRQRAADLRANSRRQLVNSVGLAVLIAAGSIYGSIWTDYPVARAAFAVTAAWGVLGQYFLHRTKTHASPPDEVGLRTSLESCRRELERHIRFDRGVHLWLGGPLLLGFGTLIGTLVVAVGGKGALVKMAGPALALVVAGALSVAIIRRSQERAFLRAIEELDRIAREQ